MKFDDFIDFLLVLTSLSVAIAAVAGMSFMIYLLYTDVNTLKKRIYIHIANIDTIPISKDIICENEEWKYNR